MHDSNTRLAGQPGSGPRAPVEGPTRALAVFSCPRSVLLCEALRVAASSRVVMETSVHLLSV